MADPASLLANQNFAPRVTDPNLRSLLTDPNFACRMREYLRERQLEIEPQQEPLPVYVLQPSWPDFNVRERKGLPPFIQEDHVQERAIDADLLELRNLVSENYESMFHAAYNNVDVCVIVPKFDFIDFRNTRKFSDQMVRTKFLDHKNIVKVLGLTTDSEDNLMIVTESLSEGSLYSCIHDKAKKLDVLGTSLQICDAMQYLHDRGVHHGNLCTKNIFVNTDKVVKLFGIDPFGERVHEGFQTVRTDIFSFGVVLWELVTREAPLDVAQSFYTVPKKSNPLKKKKTWEETCLEACSSLLWCMDTKNPLVQLIDKCWECQEIPLTFADVSTFLRSLLTPQEKEVYADNLVSYDTPKKIKRNLDGKNREKLGVFGCKSCSRSFKSEMALQAHTFAKHNGKNTETLGVFGCKSCSRSFTLEMALQAHTFAKHNANI